MSAKAISRLSVLDGIVIAAGRCGAADNPVITYDGIDLPKQSLSRNQSEGGVIDFRASAHAFGTSMRDNTKLAVRFSDGTSLRRSLPNTSDAHGIQNEFISLVKAHPSPTLIEIGSRARSGTTHTHKFPNLTKYVGVDIAPGPNVTLVADAHRLSHFTEEKFDFGYSLSVFEHLIMPWVAAYELGRVIKTGGYVYILSHPLWPLHEVPWDFFRFSENAYRGLFNRFTGFEIVRVGYSFEAAIVPLNASNGPLQTIDQSLSYLCSACLARKVDEPAVDWSCDPSVIFDLNYSHGPIG